MYKYLFSLFFLIPTIVSAATPTDFKGVVNFILGYITLLVQLIFGITFIVIMWGVVNAWIINAGNAEKREAGQMIALWGVIGLAVMAGVWGLVALLRTSVFGI